MWYLPLVAFASLGSAYYIGPPLSFVYRDLSRRKLRQRGVKKSLAKRRARLRKSAV
jgi:hypothetical protein